MGAISNLPTNPNKVDSTPNSIRPAARHSFSGLQHELNVLLRQPLSRLGELFQGLYRVLSFPMEEETLGGRRKVNRTRKFACYLIPDGVMFQGVR